MIIKLVRIILAILALSAAPTTFAAWSYIGVGTAALNDNSVPITPTIHASTTTGDTIVCVAHSGPSRTLNAVTGYTNLFEHSSAAAGYYIFAKIAGASESSPSVQFSGGTISIQSQCATFRGGTITVHATGTFSSATATNPTYPALTISQANTLVLIAGVKRTGGWTSVDAEGGFTEIAEPDNGTVGLVWNYVIQTTATNITSSVWTLVGGASGTALGQTISLTVSSPPSFSAGPALGTETATTIPVTYTASDAVSTLYLVACAKDSTAPTVAQVKAGTCTGDVAALGTASEATTGSSDSLTINSLGAVPVYDVYGVLNNTSGDSSLATLTDSCLAAATGKQIINCPTGLTSIAAGSMVDLWNALATVDAATGDILTCDTALTPGAFAWTIGLDGHSSYTGDSSRQYGNCVVYDTSVKANNAQDIDAWFNDPGIDCSGPQVFGPLKVGEAITAIDLLSNCSSSLGDALTASISVGTLSSGLILDPTGVAGACAGLPVGGCVYGTPDTEDEGGDDITVTITSNVTGAFNTYTATIFPIDTITVTDCTTAHLDAGLCAATLANIWLNSSINFANHPSIAVGAVISQVPAGGAEAEALSTVTLMVSLGPSGVSGSGVSGSGVSGPGVSGPGVHRRDWP